MLVLAVGGGGSTFYRHSRGRAQTPTQPIGSSASSRCSSSGSYTAARVPGSGRRCVRTGRSVPLWKSEPSQRVTPCLLVLFCIGGPIIALAPTPHGAAEDAKQHLPGGAGPPPRDLSTPSLLAHPASSVASPERGRGRTGSVPNTQGLRSIIRFVILKTLKYRVHTIVLLSTIFRQTTFMYLMLPKTSLSSTVFSIDPVLTAV